MSKKEWFGAFAIAGLYLLGKQMISNDTPKIAHASDAPKEAHASPTTANTSLSAVYHGPRLDGTNWISREDRDPMTGQNSYSTFLLASDTENSKAGLGFKCDTEASANLIVLDPSNNLSSQDNIFFDAKEGDGEIFQVFGLRLGTDNRGTIFQLEEAKLENRLDDGIPLYMRYTIGNRVRTIMFVPNNSQKALSPIKACKH